MHTQGRAATDPPKKDTNKYSRTQRLKKCKCKKYKHIHSNIPTGNCKHYKYESKGLFLHRMSLFDKKHEKYEIKEVVLYRMSYLKRKPVGMRSRRWFSNSMSYLKRKLEAGIDCCRCKSSSRWIMNCTNHNIFRWIIDCTNHNISWDKISKSWNATLQQLSSMEDLIKVECKEWVDLLDWIYYMDPQDFSRRYFAYFYKARIDLGKADP